MLNNYCEGGVDFAPLLITCPGKSLFFGVFFTLIVRTLGWVAIILIIFVIARHILGIQQIDTSKLNSILEKSVDSDESTPIFVKKRVKQHDI